jgi:hypothetical protein
MNGTPHFESEFLEDLAIAFRKRRRSLSQRACRVDLAKTYDVRGEQKFERLEIELSGVVGKSPMLRFHAWASRDVWIDARRLAKEGWAWSWTNEGRFAGDCGPRHFIEALGSTYALIGDMSAGRTATLNDIWKPLLARGPSIVR